MKEYKLTSWQDYRKIFDEMIDLLNKENKAGIILEFQNAQRLINGLTDGWYEFKFAFEKTLGSNRQNMTDEQIHIADYLLSELNKSLKRK